MAQYTAFISYSHRDRAFADWLHRRLEAYRIPARLVGTPARDGPVPARLYPVFRDREELPTSDDLSTQILGALDRSATLIVICSPDAAASRWVNEEIRIFRQMGRGGRILAIIARGVPNAAAIHGAEAASECFPPALVQLPATAETPAQQIEPIAADARPEGDGREHALLKIIAGMLGIGFEALRQRELEAQRRRTRIAQGIAAAMVLLAILAAGAGGLAWQARGVAEAQRANAEAQRAIAETRRAEAVAAQAESLRQESSVLAQLARSRTAAGDAMGGTLMALEALPGAAERPWSEAAELALLESWMGLQEIAAWEIGNGPVLSMAVDNSGRWLAAGGVAGRLLLWDLANPAKPPQALQGHRGDVTVVLFSADGMRLASSGGDQRVRLWSIGASAVEGIDLPVPGDGVEDMVMAPDGRTLLASGRLAGLTLWREQGGKWLAETLAFNRRDWGRQIVLSPDGRRAAWLGADRLWVVDLPAEGSPRLVMEVEQDLIASGLAFTPDGESVVVVGLTGAHLWRVGQISREPVVLTDDELRLEAVAIGGAAGTIVGAGWDGALHLWSAEGLKLARLTGHEGPITGLAFMPDRNALVSMGMDGAARLWAIEGVESSLISSFAGHVGSVVGAAFRADPPRLVTAGRDGALRLFDPTARRARPLRPIPGAAAARGVLDPTGTRLIAVTPERIPTLLVTDPSTPGAPLARIALSSRISGSPVADAGARHLAVLGLGPAVRGLLAWGRDVEGRYQPITLAGGEEAGPGLLAMDPSGRWLATASSVDFRVMLWDLARAGDPPLPLPHRHGRPVSIALSPGGRHLALGMAAGPVLLWDITADQPPLRLLEGHRDAVPALAFDPAGERLASGSADRTIRIWRLADAHGLALPSHADTVRDIAFAESGDRLLAVTGAEIRLWSLAQGRPTGAQLRGLGGGITARFVSGTDQLRLVRSGGSLEAIDLPRGEALVTAARAALTRCLGDAQRQTFGLAPNGRPIAQPPQCRD